jgi:hypothetical protein
MDKHEFRELRWRDPSGALLVTVALIALLILAVALL